MKAHPWDHFRTSPDLELMRAHAQAVREVRSVLDSVDRAFKHQPPVGSPYEVYCREVQLESGPSGTWGPDAPTTSLKHHAMSLSLFAVDCLASSASLVMSGNYLFGFYPVVRSSLEASIGMLTAFDDQIDHRVRAIRYMMLVRQAAHNGRRNATDPTQRRAFESDVDTFDSMLSHLVGEDQVEKNKKTREIKSVEKERLPAFRAQFDRFGAEIGVDQYSTTYGVLSDLAHPNSPRIEGVYLGLETEDVAASVLGALHIQLGCLLVGLDRTAAFFGIRDEIDEGVQLVISLGDAIRETRNKRQKEA